MAVSWPFDSTLTQDGNGNPVYSRAYSADVLARIMARYFRNGVFATPASSLRVLQNEGMTVLVKEGAANINGRQFYEEIDRVLTVQAADASLDRIDTVVLRLNLEQSALSIDLYIVKGTAAATPVAPGLTRNASVWELGLANLFIAKGVTTVTQERITDTRMDSDRCGVVASIIGDTDTTAYYAQIGADLAAFKAGAQADFTGWSTAQKAAFGAWFADVRETLGDDAAGTLLNMINEHAPLLYSATLPTGGWSTSAPYTQTITVSGIRATDTPLVDVVLSATLATRLAQREAYGYVGMIVAATDSITVTCDEDKPTVDLTISLKVVR